MTILRWILASTARLTMTIVLVVMVATAASVAVLASRVQHLAAHAPHAQDYAVAPTPSLASEPTPEATATPTESLPTTTAPTRRPTATRTPSPTATPTLPDPVPMATEAVSVWASGRRNTLATMATPGSTFPAPPEGAEALGDATLTDSTATTASVAVPTGAGLITVDLATYRGSWRVADITLG